MSLRWKIPSNFIFSVISKRLFFLFAECAIKLADDLANPQPLLVDEKMTRFVLPNWNDTSGQIVVSPGKTIALFCPQGVKNMDEKLVRATCIGGKYFQVGQEKRLLKSIRCLKHPWISVQPQPDRSRDYCRDYSVADIGFHVVGRFIKTLSICHDLRRLASHFATYQLQPFNVAYQRNVGRLGFIQAREFNYSVNFNRLYSRQNQVDKLIKLLQSEDDLDEFYDNDKLFFSRGHLAGKVDLFAGNHQRSTFFYLNSAPQWQSINGGNWQRVEDGIRRFVGRSGVNVTVFSGTHEVLRFPGLEDGKLFLGKKEQLPVPQYFYKLLFVEESGRGIVFISINNPHVEEGDIPDYLFCEDVLEKIKWISLKDSLQHGVIFACSIDDFVENMPANLFPKFNVTGLLY